MASVHGSGAPIVPPEQPLAPPPPPPVTIEPVTQNVWEASAESKKIHSIFGGQVSSKVIEVDARNFPADQKKAPTLALAMALFHEQGIDIDLYKSFDRSRPQIVNISSVVDREGVMRGNNPGVTTIPPPPAEPKFFAGQVTFEVTVSVPPTNEWRTIRFTQEIETTIAVPPIVKNGDKTTQAKLEHEAKAKAMTLLQAYAGVMSNNQALIGNNSRINKLASTQFLTGSEVRESTSKGFYDRAIQWHKEPPSGILARINYAFEKHGSITSIKLDGGYGTFGAHQHWHNEIPCPHLKARNEKLNSLLENVAHLPARANRPNLDEPPEFGPATNQEEVIRQALQELKTKQHISSSDAVRILRKDLEGAAHDLDNKLIGDDLRISAISLYDKDGNAKPTGTVKDYIKHCEIEIKEIRRLQEELRNNPASGPDAMDHPPLVALRKAYAKYEYFRNSAIQVYQDIKTHNDRLKTEPANLRKLVDQVYATGGDHPGGIRQHNEAIDGIEELAKDHYLDARFQQFETAFTQAIGMLDMTFEPLQAGKPAGRANLTPLDVHVPARQHYATSKQKTTPPPGYTPPPPAPPPPPETDTTATGELPITLESATVVPPTVRSPLSPEVVIAPTYSQEMTAQIEEMRPLLTKRTALTNEEKAKLESFIGLQNFAALKTHLQNPQIASQPEQIMQLRGLVANLNSHQISALEKLLPENMGTFFQLASDVQPIDVAPPRTELPVNPAPPPNQGAPQKPSEVVAWIKSVSVEELAKRDPPDGGPTKLSQLVMQWGNNVDQSVMMALLEKPFPTQSWVEAFQHYQQNNLHGLSPLFTPGVGMIELLKEKNLLPELAKLCKSEGEVSNFVFKFFVDLNKDQQSLVALISRAFVNNWNGALETIANNVDKKVLANLLSSPTPNGTTMIGEACKSAKADTVKVIVENLSGLLDSVDPVLGKSPRALLQERIKDGTLTRLDADTLNAINQTTSAKTLSAEQLRDSDEVFAWIQSAKAEDLHQSDAANLGMILAKWYNNQNVMEQLHEKQIPTSVWKEAFQIAKKSSPDGIQPLVSSIRLNEAMLKAWKENGLLHELGKLSDTDYQLVVFIEKFYSQLVSHQPLLSAILKQAIDHEAIDSISTILKQCKGSLLRTELQSASTENGIKVITKISQMAEKEIITQLAHSHLLNLDIPDPNFNNKTPRDILKENVAKNSITLREEAHNILFYKTLSYQNSYKKVFGLLNKSPINEQDIAEVNSIQKQLEPKQLELLKSELADAELLDRFNSAVGGN